MSAEVVHGIYSLCVEHFNVTGLLPALNIHMDWQETTQHVIRVWVHHCWCLKDALTLWRTRKCKVFVCEMSSQWRTAAMSVDQLQIYVYVLILVIICGTDHNKRLCEHSKQVNITLFFYLLWNWDYMEVKVTRTHTLLELWLDLLTHTHTQHLVRLEKHHDAYTFSNSVVPRQVFTLLMLKQHVDLQPPSPPPPDMTCNDSVTWQVSCKCAHGSCLHKCEHIHGLQKR